LKPKIDPDRGAAKVLRSSPGASSRTDRALAPARKTRLEALASLLADDSPAVLAEVRRALEKAGSESRPALERAARSDDARIRGRARAFLMERDQRAALRRLARYASRPDIDLERALFLLARYHAPRLDPRPYQRALDAMAAEVTRRAAKERGDLERALVLCGYLGEELCFGGSRGEFHHPDNIHLHRAIERRAGVPLTLSAIWLLVARRAGIRAALVPLPGHVMLRLYGGWRSAIVDPYHKGRRRSETECKGFLEKHGITPSAASFRDAPDALLVRRQIGNLAKSAELRGLSREARDLGALLRAIDPRRAQGKLPA
jgi:regulator of sirC expression with transglutaminase-like and TPR domain